VADDDRVLKVEAFEHPRRVIDETREAEHRRHRRGPTESALVHRDHPTVAGDQGGAAIGEERAHRCAVAVKQEHRAARSALLDMELAAVGCRDRVRALTGKPKVAVGVGVGSPRQL
jgi:hypothetical protein